MTTKTTSQAPFFIMRRRDVEKKTGLSRSTIYDKLSPKSPRYDPTFPKQVRLGLDAVGWVSTEIDQWLLSKIEASRQQAA